MSIRSRVFATCMALLLPLAVAAQDLTRLVTKADVEKAAAAKFDNPGKPMDGQIMFQQTGGGMQISVDVEKREGNASVRTWESSIKKMRPATKVDTIKGVGRDAIFHSTRADMGALSADFEKPRVQLRVAVSGAKSPEHAQQIVTDLAKAVGPRVGS
ncbi:MAG: hypothetical protein EOO25_13915 [Comamonadaceae bacterium]|nr:MAG: hypothetical protein EOO25_13915 [Comamonadaceae bacterium]